MLKQLFIFLLSFFSWTAVVHAQQKDTLFQVTDTILTDSFLTVNESVHKDSLQPGNDTIVPFPTIALTKKRSGLESILKDNIFLNSSSAPVSLIQAPRKYISKDAIFYALSLILLFLGILRVTYSRYFSNLLRVFFNTSLRQGQLTDQLLQAGLPSLFFNLFFIIIGGSYIYLLLNHFGKVLNNDWEILLICISGLLLVYIIKFCTLKFAGWLTGYKGEAETYIFIVFLINKIISLCLVPIVVIISFSQTYLVNIVIIISFIIIALMFVMRFLRSYGLLQSRLKVSGFHFFLYILGIELLPLLLIYKGALVIMSKNL